MQTLGPIIPRYWADPTNPRSKNMCAAQDRDYLTREITASANAAPAARTAQSAFLS
jgi:hypothetical protein